MSNDFVLRPGVTNPSLWYPERPKESEWKKIRKVVLERDANTCQSCGHSARTYMHLHHLNETGSNEPDNLITLCVACHAVLHMGRNLDMRTIEIWRSPVSQVEIVQRTRRSIGEGKELDEINASLGLLEGSHPPDSIEYANELVRGMGDAARASLPEPLCAVFVAFKQWQI